MTEELFQEKVAIVSCGIVEEELRSILKNDDSTLKAFFLNPELHVDFEMLARELTKTLEKLSDSFDSFVVVYGGCHPMMDDMLASYPAVRVKARNCVEMILGRENYKNELRKERGTFFLPPGWCKVWKRVLLNQLRLDKNLGKDVFKNYRKALFIDVGIDTEKYRSMAKEFSEYFSLQFEEKKTDLKHLRRLLESALVVIIDSGRLT